MDFYEEYWDIYNQIKQNMFYEQKNNAINSYNGKYLIKAIQKNKRRTTDITSHHQITTRGIAHDINNMLSIIVGYLDIILTNDELSINDRQHLLKALEASQMLEELNSLLLKGESDTKRCDSIQSISELIKQTIEVMLGVNTDIVWDVSYASDVEPFKISCVHLKRIIQNLVKNAVEAMPNGGRFSIQLKNVIVDKVLPNGYQAGKYVQITIHDEGCGIPHELQKNLFRAGITSKENGNGLGLRITRYLIQLNNGFINVQSGPDSGTSFNIYFPVI